VAVGVAAVGFAYAWWARIHLGRLWSSTVTLKADHAIVRSGPYALTRHPIYTGLLLAVIATAVVEHTVGAVIGTGFMITGFVVKLRQEEHLLTQHFGAAYDAYRRDVPALVPRPW